MDQDKDQGHGQGGTHNAPNYMAIFYTLAVLTAVEVGWAKVLHDNRKPLVIGLVIFAGVKAVMVALFFMHLRFERKILGIIFASTLILGVILVSVGMAEHFLPRP
jgi:cytochrome c oxidase subunit 4